MRKIKFDIKISSIIAILVYHISFINLPYISIYGALKYLALIGVTIFLLVRKKIFFLKKFWKINLCVTIFCMSIILSSIYNLEFGGYKRLLLGVFHAFIILDIFLFFEYVNLYNKSKECFKIFYNITLFYIIINDFIVIFLPQFFYRYENYFIGNKFNVAYLHILLLVLFYQINLNVIKKKRIKFLLMTLFSTYIIIRVECTTALTGIVVLSLGIICKKILEKILISKKIMLISLFISNLVLLISKSILENPIVSYIIVDILKEDLTLTGRMRIYEEVPYIIKDRLLLGYGVGNAHFVFDQKLHYAPNAQNGLLQCIVVYGIIGTVLMLMIMYLSMKNLSVDTYMYPIILIIYIYILFSSVEITLGITILIFFAMISAQASTNDNKNKIKV